MNTQETNNQAIDFKVDFKAEASQSVIIKTKVHEFNVGPLLDYVVGFSSPEEVAKELDEVMQTFFTHFCVNTMSSSPGLGDCNIYYTLRRLRNALLIGSTGADLGND